jgi:penicillin amidase
MRILKIVLLVLLLIVVVVVVGGFVVYNDVTRGPLPQDTGTLSVSGLQAEVEILRDEYGIPHIYASNTHDLNFAQGFVQAQDRWWQMEFARHIGHGRIEELTGYSDAVIGSDVFIRTAGWTEAAERDLAVLDEETIAALQAFSDGVNAYISSRSPNQLALEYRLLGLTGVDIVVEPWTPVDSLVWGKVMAWNLTDTYDRELTRASLLETLGEDMANDYTPPWPYGGDKPTILADSDLPITEASAGSTTFNLSAQDTASLEAAGSITGELAYIGASSAANNPSVGSNNWVSTGSMTESGMPLLANDPHLGIQMPSIWYEIGLHCLPVTDECPYDVRGFAMPAAPGVIIGHNAEIAWGQTNVGADVQDLYAITVNPDNPLQYEWNGEWRDMTVRDETINFGDGVPSITIQVRETHLGPIINDNRLDPETNLPMGFNNEDPLALRWTGYEPSALFQSIMMLNRASNWEEFREALTYWTVPSQNFVYADVAGNIGYQTPGLIPIRPTGVDGITPTTGSSDDIEWQGFIPFENLPRIFNPERDYIATANQAVVPMEYYDQLAETLGADANYLMSYDWSYGYRGQRINQLMNELAPLSVDDYQAIHGDNFDINAQEMFPFVIGLDYNDETLNGARDWLAFWDFHSNKDNAQTVLWNYFAAHLLDNVFTDQLPEDIQASSHNLYSIAQMMNEPDNAWWDDANTADVVETRDDIIRQSFSDGYAQAIAELGADREAWKWGDAHGAVFVSNPLGLSGIDVVESLVNRGPQPTGGGNEIVNATGWSLMDGLNGDFTLGSLPSMRMIVDMANLDNSQTIITTGQSGHPFSPHYDDQIEQWANIEYHPMLFSREAVERGTAQRLLLVPADS